jgi:hypothetical protein
VTKQLAFSERPMRDMAKVEKLFGTCRLAGDGCDAINQLLKA